MPDHAIVQRPTGLRRILYWSSSTVPPEDADLVGILNQSRHNNAIDGVTGILWADGARFVQVFEGPPGSVEATWGRIRADPRHHEITVLQDLAVEQRAFGYWSMVHRRAGDPLDDHDWHMHRLLSDAAPAVAQPFIALIGCSRATPV